MWHELVSLCQEYPQIPIFLSLAVGYFIGKIKFFGFSLGATSGVLLSALVIGQIGVDIPDLLKNITFALFTFCIGYKVGPQFFGALKKEGLNYIWISLVVAFIGLFGAIGLGKMLHFDKGTTAGFFAGSMTQSAAIGTAEGAVKHLSISDAEKANLDSNIAVSYAITYIFGTVGVLVFLKIAPGLMGINLKNEAKKLERQMSGGEAEEGGPEFFSWTKMLDLRAYKAVQTQVIGKTVKECESLFTGRVAIDKIKRGNQVIDAKAEEIIRQSDLILIIGKNNDLLNAEKFFGPEIDRTAIANIIGEVLEICVLNPKIAGKTLQEISKNKETHGVFLLKAMRQGNNLPITNDTVINKCDVIQVMGTKEDIERIAKLTGYPERQTGITDMIMVGIGCVIGTFIGMIAVPVFGIPLTLGIGGGVLVSGLIFGWLRAVHPTFGQIPQGAQWFLMNFGLNAFIACLGLSAGPKAVAAFETTGLSVFLAGCVLSLAPVVVGLIFGKYVLKMNPVLLFGAVAGARVLTAALNLLQEECESSTPVLGYAAPYAFGNVLLVIWGTVIVNIM